MADPLTHGFGGADTEQVGDRADRGPFRLILVANLRDHADRPLTQLWRILLRTHGLHPSSEDEVSRPAGAIQVSGLRVWEASTSRLDAHIKRIALNGHREKARRQRVILSEMMGMAVRHDAIDRNPVREVADLPRKCAKPRSADMATLAQLRAQLADWVDGAPLDGSAGYTYGPKRNQRVLDVVDVELGTGPRPGETLTLRWSDVDLESQPPRITFAGTIVRLKGNGLIRQPRTKTDSGYRTVLIPPFVVETLRRVLSEAVPNDLDLVFPNRDGGIWDPHNFNRLWKQARGEKFAWITAKTFRKTVATMIATAHSPEDAARQLGHSGDAVTRRHYIDQPTQAPDFTETLERLKR
ncbi:tyrosine-type recombinase/integrase [Nocardia halotolerans]|uniref:Tyrosine-type recombinase/integrase n=1 Tax=Nocardia halotolerans TaxID=1755878 RepID=A0ABV8VBD5_9NOCA